MRNESTISKWGNSLAIRIPLAIARQASLGEGDCVSLTLSRGKAALVVIDDVWNIQHLEQLLVDDAPRSRFLFTTRDKSIVRAKTNRCYAADVLSTEEARSLLALWANVESARLPPAESAAIIEACGGLALALAQIGGQTVLTLPRRSHLGRAPSCGCLLQRGFKGVGPLSSLSSAFLFGAFDSIDRLDHSPRAAEPKSESSLTWWMRQIQRSCERRHFSESLRKLKNHPIGRRTQPKYPEDNLRQSATRPSRPRAPRVGMDTPVLSSYASNRN